MPIIVRKPKSHFAPAPEGLHVAVCCDVWDPWTEERAAEWGGGLVDKTRVVWQTEEIDPATNRPYEVSQIYTFSLHEKAKLCQHLESWRGRKFTSDEKDGFDIEKLIGASCQVQVVHKVTDAGTYANVQAVVPLGKGQTKLRVSDGYVRKKDRQATDNHAQASQADADDSVPF